jgi:8-oxo-dGTP diphosphatase
MSAPLTMPTPIAIAVVQRQGCYLVGQRPEGAPLAGLWEFPGGKIEPGESPEVAAVRECLEETGIAAIPLFRYPEHLQQYDHDRVLLHFIACRPVAEVACRPVGENPPAPRAPFRWLPRAELSRLEFPRGNRGLLAAIESALIAD